MNHSGTTLALICADHPFTAHVQANELSPKISSKDYATHVDRPVMAGKPTERSVRNNEDPCDPLATGGADRTAPVEFMAGVMAAKRRADRLMDR